MNVRSTRAPAVAGRFYPGDPDHLVQVVDAFLATPEGAPKPPSPAPKALIVPHAGYPYSGQTAGVAFRSLGAGAKRVRRVVLLGPAHRVPVEGLALPEQDTFSTPLGAVEVDREACDLLRSFPGVQVDDRPHALEHALEVQLPFLQRALDDFRIVPLVVGRTEPGSVAAVLQTLWGGEETLIVVSSDLSHYLPYATATQIDGDTAHTIVEHPELPIEPERACGAYCINGMQRVATERHLRCELLELCNSGDTAGSHDAVVGYAAFAYYAPKGVTP